MIVQNKYIIEWIFNRLWVYYGSNEKKYIFIKPLMDKIDIELFENKKTNIDLNKNEINQLLKFIDIIQKESETWDEWSIITGTSLEELREFKQKLQKINQ